MILFDDLIRRVRSGEWVQFFSEGNCYQFCSSETISLPLLDVHAFNDSISFSIVLSTNRLKALGYRLSDDGKRSYSFKLNRFESVSGLINPLHSLLDSSALDEPLIELNSDFNLIMKLIKCSKLLPSFIYHQCTYNPQLPLLDLNSVKDKLNNNILNLEKVSEVRVPITQTDQALFVAFRPSDGGPEHIAIVIGDLKTTENPLIRIHSECFTGDLFSSLRCDCGSQLKGAIEMMCQENSGILIYLAQEGRGIGLLNKLRSYQLQDQGIDTVDANLKLGFEADERNYLVAAKILEILAIKKVKLLTNNPEKVTSLQNYGIQVTDRVSHVFPTNPFNETYMETKKLKSGHLF